MDRTIDLVYRRDFEYAELQGGWVALFWGLWLVVAKARAFNCVCLFPDLPQPATRGTPAAARRGTR